MGDLPWRKIEAKNPVVRVFDNSQSHANLAGTPAWGISVRKSPVRALVRLCFELLRVRLVRLGHHSLFLVPSVEPDAVPERDRLPVGQGKTAVPLVAIGE